MNGGPSHVDTFDPKPALEKYAGQQPSEKLYKKSKGSGYVPSPLKFTRAGKSGIDVSETLPNLAQVIDDCCVVRSMHTDVPNHEPALLMMNTGNVQPIRPSLGSWLMYGLGTENQNLPGYVVLRPSNKIVVGPALWSSGFLPAQYQATTVFTENMQVDKLVPNVRNPALTREQQREQLDLLQNLNRHHLAQRDGDGQLEGRSRRWRRRSGCRRGDAGVRRVEGAAARARAVRQLHLRPLVPAGPADWWRTACGS
jgi:hypothetical protein